MAWQQQQQQPPLSPQQQHDQQQQQQTVTLSNPMMPATTFYLSSGGNIPLQQNAVIQPMGYTMPIIRNPTIAETYQSRQSTGLGITLIIIGVLTSIFNGVGFAVNDRIAPVGHGFWCGALFIVTGVFGVVAANKNKCLIVTFMILSITSAVITVALLCLGLSGVFAHANLYYFYGSNGSEAAVAMESLLAILAIVAAIVSIWGSAICCRAVCCCGTVYSTMLTTPYGNQQVMIISQQQQLPTGTVQYARSQVMPMEAFAPHSANPLPMQYWTSGPPTQPGQPQQYFASNQQQSYAYASAASSNQMPWTTVGHPSSVDDPPAYNSSQDNKGNSP